jgi:hypothetical protein
MTLPVATPMASLLTMTVRGKGAAAIAVPALGLYPLLGLAALLCGLGCWQGARRRKH